MKMPEISEPELTAGARLRWSLIANGVGAVLIAVSVLPELFAGSAPGFGPMQSLAAIAGGVAMVVGTLLLLRVERKARKNWLLAMGITGGRAAAKLLLCFGSLAIAVAAAESWARWRAKPSDDQRRWLELIRDFPDGEQLAKDRGEWNNFHGLVYRDYYLYDIAPRKLPTSTYTSFFSDRPCPASAPEQSAQQRVWFFGGSTMMNIETTDERTIANTAVQMLNESGVSATGHNFGTGMFQSCLELVKFQEILRRVPKNRRPTVVVFYDGFNDANCGYFFGAGRMQSDVAGRLQMLVEHHHWDMVRVGVVEGLFEKSRLYQDYGRWLAGNRAALAGLHKDASEENLAQTVTIYQTNLDMVRGICRQFDIRPVLVLQPLVVTKRGRSREEEELYASFTADGSAGFVERFYAKAREALADYPEFVDLSHLLDNDGRTDFYDLGHTGPYTGADVGKALGKEILFRLQNPAE